MRCQAKGPMVAAPSATSNQPHLVPGTTVLTRLDLATLTGRGMHLPNWTRSWREPLHKIIANRYGGRNLPVTLVLPDGGRVPLSSEPEVEILARTWRGLKALAAPAMGALARAYVHNDIDFTGSARRAAAIAEAMVGEIAHGRDALHGALADLATPAPQQPREHRATTTTSRTRSTASGSTRSWSTRARISRPRTTTLADAQARKLDHICRKLRLAPGERFLDIGCGWGALVFRAAAEIRRRRDRHHAVEEPVRARERRDRRARARRPRARRARATTSTCPKTRSTTRSRASGMFEHVGIARFPKYFGKIHRILKPGGFVLNHGITHNPLGARDASAAASATSSRNTCFPGGELAHVATVIEGMAAQGLEVIDAEALREHYAKTLWHWCERLEAECGRGARGGRRGKVSACGGIYLAGSAHAFERGWLSLWQLLAGKPLPDGRLAASADARLHVPGREDARGGACRGGACNRRGLAAICGGMTTLRRWSPDRPSRCSSFPPPSPIKVMGRTQDGFAQAIVTVVQKHAPDFEPATVEMRASSHGKYLSLTCTVNAVSREQLDDLYRDLTSHPMVAMVL